MNWSYPLQADGVWIARRANEQRADWAEAAVERFRERCAGDADLSALSDLIANLGHLYDRLAATRQLDRDLLHDPDDGFAGIIALALRHYEAERGEGDDLEQVPG